MMYIRQAKEFWLSFDDLETLILKGRAERTILDSSTLTAN